jgi:hypothetical protein
MKTYIALHRIEVGGGYAGRGDEIKLPDEYAELLLKKGRIMPRPRRRKPNVVVIKAAEETTEELTHGTNN